MSGKIKWESYRIKMMIILVIFAAEIMLYFIGPFPVQANIVMAQEEIEAEKEAEKIITDNSRIMAAVGETDAYEEPDVFAAVVVSYHDGDPIYVTGEAAEGWYRIRYQDLNGYVRMEQVTEMALDVAALDDEFALEAEEGKLVVEEVERQRTEVRRSRIWGAVIILLVLGVFATGIISSVKNGGRERECE